MDNATTYDLREHKHSQITPSCIANLSHTEYPEPRNDVPLCVCDGIGVDSTGMLIGMRDRGIRPDLISFANTGNEKRETIDYIATRQQWLAANDFPPLLIVQYTPPEAEYTTLYGNCFANETLPSIAFGMKSCSLKWKKAPQDHW